MLPLLTVAIPRAAQHITPPHEWITQVGYLLLFAVAAVVCIFVAGLLFKRLAGLPTVTLRLHKNGIGYCEQCGYDLRATSIRCPECGRKVPPLPRRHRLMYLTYLSTHNPRRGG